MPLDQSRARREVSRFHELAGADLAAVGAFHAQHIDASVGAHDGKARVADVDDFAELAADAFRSLCGKGLRVKNLQRLAVESGPRAGRGTAAANQRIDLAPRLAPVDAGGL